MALRVSCAIIIRDHTVLAAQRSVSMQHPLKWEFPGGKVEPGETPAASIVREIHEELNWEVKVLRSAPVVRHPKVAPRIELIPFVCQVVAGDLHLLEHAQVRWCRLAELPALDWGEADLGVLEWCLSEGQDLFQLHF